MAKLPVNSSFGGLFYNAFFNHTLVVRHPDMDFAKVTLGIFYANLAEFFARDHKDFRDAARKSSAALERTLQINKEYPEAHFTLGRLEVLSGRVEKATPHLEVALRLNPKYTRARAFLAETYLRESDVAKGLKVCDESPLQDPHILCRIHI